MQQRRLRLGDILDDYCPRERRITNHAVVAMIEDAVKQTRCTTCNADHEYKQAKIPAARRKKDGLTLTMPADPLNDGQTFDDAPLDDDTTPLGDESSPIAAAADVAIDLDPAEEADLEAEAETGEEPEAREDDGPVHRRLIRATLPRIDGQVPERKAPDFTVRQPGSGRGRDFDADRNGNAAGGGQQRHGRGRRAMRGPQGPSSGQPPRFGGGGPRQGSPQGQGQGQGQRQNGNRSGPPAGQRGGGARPQGQSRGPGRKRGR